MTGAEIRAQFIKLSGRYDLVNADGSDNGANWFIDAGQRYLDRMLGDLSTTEDPLKSCGKLVLSVAQGEYFKSIFNARAIYNALMMTTDGQTTHQLKRETANTLRLNYYPDSLVLDYNEQAVPTFYAPVNTRYVPNVADSVARNIANITTTLNNNLEYNGILFLAPADTAYYLEVQGLFYSPSLVEDDAESYWSVVHPDVLMTAALYKLEVFYRNTEGARDYAMALERDVKGLDMDVVAQQSFNSKQMEG